MGRVGLVCREGRASGQGCVHPARPSTRLRDGPPALPPRLRQSRVGPTPRRGGTGRPADALVPDGRDRGPAPPRRVTPDMLRGPSGPLPPLLQREAAGCLLHRVFLSIKCVAVRRSRRTSGQEGNTRRRWLAPSLCRRLRGPASATSHLKLSRILGLSGRVIQHFS